MSEQLLAVCECGC